ncbi:MAG: hypothetical protein H7Y88_06335 [Phycisphaerales bacterium]|nr:hypothetical protein [Phycisphaerales bacterium]
MVMRPGRNMSFFSEGYGDVCYLAGKDIADRDPDIIFHGAMLLFISRVDGVTEPEYRRSL